MKNLKGSLILLITAMIWGLGFVFQELLIRKGMHTFNFLFFRSLFGSISLSILVLIQNRQNNSVNNFLDVENNNSFDYDTKKENIKDENKKLLIVGFICGCILVSACGLQQFGMYLYPDNVAVSGRASFLSSTYVVLTALIQTLRGRRPSIIVILATLLSMVGVYFLSFVTGLENFQIGDIVIFASVILYTFHILVIDNFSDLNAIKLSCLQLVFSTIISLPLMLHFEGIEIQALKSGIWEILFMGVMSSGAAYTLQMIGQKYCEPTIAVLTMCLESVFATISGYVILGEKLSSNELLGACLVFASAVLAQLPSIWYNKQVNLEKT